MNKKIALIGEDPNDTISVKNLLTQKSYDKTVSFVLLIKNKRGHQLDNARTKNALEIEHKRQKPDIIVFIRDSDGICTEHSAIEKCKKWHSDLSSVVKAENILLVNIYELEALIFADIDTFNGIYKTDIKGNRDVTFIKEPKEVLINKTKKLQKKYSESDCPDLFSKMKIDNVIKNCSYFNDFFTKFSALVNDKTEQA